MLALFFHAIICIRQALQFLQFYLVSLAELCTLLLNIFEKLHLINSEVNLRLDTPLKLATIKSLKMRNCKIMLKATKT